MTNRAASAGRVLVSSLTAPAVYHNYVIKTGYTDDK